MFNWANLTFRLMVVAGAFCGYAAAHRHKAGVLACMLISVGGFFVGAGIGKLSCKYAYVALFSVKLPTFVRVAVYFLIPMFGILATCSAMFLLAEVLYR